ncbi:MAG: dephospho-CoA kinase [Gammaproteobacteria bacterium]|nr:MAG: dephospho-CoA kinase [Gammaproteobacteria bacterium]
MAAPLKIGLTGGIASGKSTVADLFEELGIDVIDADRISRELVEPGSPLLEQIEDRLGSAFIDALGRLDRTRLREHIFSHPKARKTLEGILHPAIREEMEQRARKSRSPYVVLVIPLLIETGQQELVDRILVVDVPERAQIERVVERDGISAEQARKILESQAKRDERLAAADDVIRNTGSPDSLREEVERLHRHYLQLAGSGFD